MNVGIAIGLIAIAFVILLALGEHERRQRRRRMGLPTTITVDDGSMFPDDRWTKVTIGDELIEVRPLRCARAPGLAAEVGDPVATRRVDDPEVMSRAADLSADWRDDVPPRYRIPERKEQR